MRLARAALALVGMLLLAAACQDIPRARETPDLLPPGRPERVDASTFGTRWPIKHVVFIIKENRTTDHMFGRFPGVNGVIEGLDGDRRRPLTPALDRLPEDIPHCYECAIESWNEGRMNNFAQNEPCDLYAYTQMQGREDLPNYWRWAEEYALSDNFFASAQGPSFPNHLFTIAAQSGGTHSTRTRIRRGSPCSHRTPGSPSPGVVTRWRRHTSRSSTARARWRRFPHASTS